MSEPLNNLTRDQIDAIKLSARAASKAPPALHGPVDPVGLVIAEGDSWFDYPPGLDVLDLLHRNHGMRIERYSKAGDTLENMVYGTRLPTLFDDATPTIEPLIARVQQAQPRVFLFSGGGNDVAGDEFGSFLNHQSSPAPGLRAEFVDYMLGTVFPDMYRRLIARVSAVSPSTRIFSHGYARPIPDGRGVSFLGMNFVGPWLAPALRCKRLFDAAGKPDRSLVVAMIDRFNAMLAQLQTENPNTFCYVDVRPLVTDNDWVNELHLTNDAYALVAKAFNDRVRAELQLPR